MKRILITGAGSYIGTSVEGYLKGQKNYKIDTLDVKNDNWKTYAFFNYDVVFHVAGIAHAETGKLLQGKKKKYYDVNTKLALEVAKKAKSAGV